MEENTSILNLDKKMAPLIRNVIGVVLFLISGFIFFFTSIIVQSSAVEEMSVEDLFSFRATSYIAYTIALISFFMCRTPRRVKESEVLETFSIPLYVSTLYDSSKKLSSGVTDVKFSPSCIEIDLNPIGIKKIEKIYWNKILSTKWFTDKIYSIKTDSFTFFISAEKPISSYRYKKHSSNSVIRGKKDLYLWALHQYARYYANDVATKWRNNTSAVFLMERLIFLHGDFYFFGL